MIAGPNTKSQSATPQAPSKRAQTRLTKSLDGPGTAQVNAEPLLRLMRSAPNDTANIIDAIEHCPALTARLLSVINSAAFGLPRTIESVRRAVLQLGAPRARSLGLAFAMRAIQSTQELPLGMAQNLWVMSVRKACAARLVCELMDPDHADDAFCLALLQNIGLPALIAADPGFYESRMRSPGKGTWCQREAAHFGVDHAAVGAQLLEKWGAPESIRQTVLMHHEPPLRQSSDPMTLRMCTFLASLLPHFDESPSGYEREWLTALHGQLLSKAYASPEAFLDAVADAARKILGDTQPIPLGQEVAGQLAQLVCDDTAEMVGQLCRIEELLSQIQKQTSELRFAACTDSLTNVLNRRGFYDLAQRRLASAAAQSKGVLLLAVDVDNFKKINDTCGHEAGDRLLCTLAQRLRDNLDRQDLIGRLGGDEFVMLVVDVDEERALSVTNRVNRRCNGVTTQIDESHSVDLNFSLGAVHFPLVKANENLDRLLQAADEAMYRRKRDGKAGFVFLRYAPDADDPPPVAA